VPAFELVAALGSSFAAGPGIEPVADAAAMRSARNYPHLLAERLGARLVDLSVSGATTANLLDTPQETFDGAALPPQLEGVPADADLVTITAGGNDLGFIAGMLYAAWSRVDPTSPILTMLDAVPSGGDAPLTDAALESATVGLSRVVERVRARAPGARIFLVDYLHPLDASSISATPFDEAEITALLDVQDAIDRMFRDAARRSGAELLAASSLSVGHALGSPTPWVQPFREELAEAGGSFHPNEAGMTAIAAALERALSP
jgi:lysophospholipase L1-like esterase